MLKFSRFLFIYIIFSINSTVFALDIVPTYDINVTADQKIVINSVIQEFEKFFDGSTTIHLTILNEDMGLALFPSQPGAEYILSLEGNALATTDNFTWEGVNSCPASARIRFNNNAAITWHWTLNAPPAEAYDGLSTARHEIAHAIGFAAIYPTFATKITEGPGENRTYNGRGFTATLVPEASGTHLDAISHPNDLMNALIGTGERRDISLLDRRAVCDAFDLCYKCVCISLGPISFSPNVDYPTGTYPLSVFASDLDGDTDQDLVVSNHLSNTISVFKNNGDGTFPPKVDYGTGVYPWSVFASDLDGDGDKDLVVGNELSNTVSVLKNNGDGTFAAKIDYGTGAQPTVAFASDLDKDTDPDVAVANWNSNTVSVLMNNGDGTFAAKIDYVTGIKPLTVIASDIDGDRHEDLVAANEESHTVSVFKNNGAAIFAPKVDFETGNYPAWVFASDLDGDGDHDLVTANYYSNTVSVLKNQCSDCSAKPGDVNADNKYSLPDIINEVNIVFKGAPKPTPACRADANADGNISLPDIIKLVNKVFKGGSTPPPIGVCCL